MDVYPFASVIHKHDEIVVLELLEGITAESTPRLAETLDMIINEGKVKILMDFGKCDTICSTGLGILHFYRSRVVSKGGELKLARACSFIKTVVEQTLGKGYFGIYEDIAEAINSFINAPSPAPLPGDIKKRRKRSS